MDDRINAESTVELLKRVEKNSSKANVIALLPLKARQGISRGHEDRTDIPTTLFAEPESDRTVLEVLQTSQKL